MIFRFDENQLIHEETRLVRLKRVAPASVSVLIMTGRSGEYELLF